MGALGVAAINLGFELFDEHVTRTIPLLLLIVPVSIASVLGGWKASVPLAILTGLWYAFHYVAPARSPRIGLTEGTASVLTYTVVALFISELDRRLDVRRQRSEEQRAMLLRTVSHDLRNPLSAIRTASQDLRSAGMLDSADRDRLLDMVIEEAARLDRIIRNLLSLSRIEAGALRPSLEACSLDEIVSAAVRRLTLHAGSATPRIAVDLADDLPEVLADPVQLDQVITNIIENALRHAAGSDEVSVRARAAGDSVEIVIEDQGPGFSPFAREQMFEIFKPSGITGVEGVGLAVCKAIVEAHGGTIHVDESSDGGARVSFAIQAAPRRAVHADR
jgi:K+-sensing histidine kinase KdpD